MMRNDIYIHGTGTISPQKPDDSSNFLAEVKRPENGVLRCVEPDYKAYIPKRMVRRMSRVIKMGVASARICLNDAGIELPDAIVTGTGLGCLADTDKFLSGMIDNEEEMLNPTAFMQSTHNTIGAQIALMIQCKAYNYTYVHRGFSFENALQDSMLSLTEGDMQHVLVGGFDELTDTFYKITKRLDCWQDAEGDNAAILTSKTKGTIPGEGSTFLALSSQEQTTNGAAPYAKLKGLTMLYRPGSTTDVEQSLLRLLAKAELSMQDIDLVVMPYNGDIEADEFSRNVHHDVIGSIPQACFKHLSGEYHTASAFGLWLCAQMIAHQSVPEVMQVDAFEGPQINNVLLYNHYKQRNHSLMLVGKA